MKNKPFQSLSCTWNFLQVWGIVQGDKIIHLSFDRRRHRSASNHEILGAVSQGQHEKMCAFLLSTLQGKTIIFPERSPFIVQGTAFQRRVWHALSLIPFATTRTYGDIACQLGNPHLARAVGQACNKNPLPLIIPCHRVVSSKGLGGFAGGSKAKQALLDYEQEWLKREDAK